MEEKLLQKNRNGMPMLLLLPAVILGAVGLLALAHWIILECSFYHLPY